MHTIYLAVPLYYPITSYSTFFSHITTNAYTDIPSETFNCYISRPLIPSSTFILLLD